MTRALRLLVVLLASLASLTSVALAANADTNIHITQFQMLPTIGPEPASPPLTQAGGTPNVSLFMRFCGQGLPIQSISASNVVTTQTPHGISQANTFVKI